MIETDASDAGIATVLSVEKDGELKPIKFYSKTFAKSARNWPTYKKGSVCNYFSIAEI